MGRQPQLSLGHPAWASLGLTRGRLSCGATDVTVDTASLPRVSAAITSGMENSGSQSPTAGLNLRLYNLLKSLPRRRGVCLPLRLHSALQETK